MSKKTKKRHRIRTRYFDKLRETSELVDPYVENFTRKYIQLSSELKGKILSRYRFRKPKLRPAQTRFAYELVGGKDWKKIIPICAAIEVKDTSYYCTDDVFDKNGKTRELYVIGNLLSTIADAMVTQVASLTSKENFQQIMQSLFRLDGDIYQGFYIDENMKGTDYDYYMKKAYAYNYWEHILKMGAILGGANQKDIKKIAEIGKNIGIAYTIANDTCDFGKPNLEDFYLGKATLPIIWAIEHTKGKDKKTLEDLIEKTFLTEQEKNEVRKIFVQSGAINYGKQKAKEFCDIAINSLKEFPESEAREMLEFSTTMTQRNKFYDFLKKYTILHEK